MGTSAGSFVGARLALGAERETFADPIIAEQIPGQGPTRGRPWPRRSAPPDALKA